MTENTDGDQNETNATPTPSPATAAQTETEQAKDASQTKESKPSITTPTAGKGQQTLPADPEQGRGTGGKTNKEIIYYRNVRCQSWISLVIGFLIAGIGIGFLVLADKTSTDKLIGTIVIGTVIEITAWICFYIHRRASNQLDRVGRFILAGRVYEMLVDSETRKELAKIITQEE